MISERGQFPAGSEHLPATVKFKTRSPFQHVPTGSDANSADDLSANLGPGGLKARMRMLRINGWKGCVLTGHRAGCGLIAVIARDIASICEHSDSADGAEPNRVRSSPYWNMQRFCCRAGQAPQSSHHGSLDALKCSDCGPSWLCVGRVANDHLASAQGKTWEN